jgi:hypothetical protein
MDKVHTRIEAIELAAKSPREHEPGASSIPTWLFS